ncbi:MAG: cupin domain-containing protein [Myxococcota bacterium]
MSHAHSLDLDDLLAPHTAATFVDEFLERAPLHVSGDTGRFEGLFDLDDVDDLLTRGYLSSDDRFGVFRDGQRQSPPHLRALPGFGSRQREVTIASWIRDRHLAGDTVVGYRIENQFRALGKLARNLGRTLGARVDIGFYLTPGGTQGLAPHWDYMDVIVLQIAGTKRWRLYGEGAELPVKPRKAVFKQPLGEAEPTHDLVLSPGDFLYLPRGTVHDVSAQQEQSLHLTIGIHRPQWHEVMADMLFDMAQTDPELRRSVPLDLADQAEHARRLFARCAENLDASALEALIQRTRLPDAPLRDGQLDLQTALHTEVDGGTRVRKREGIDCVVETTGEHVSFAWPGSEPAATIRAPRQVAAALEFIADADGSFEVDELPDSVTEGSKRVLVTRLLRAGVLKPVPVDAAASA